MQKDSSARFLKCNSPDFSVSFDPAPRAVVIMAGERVCFHTTVNHSGLANWAGSAKQGRGETGIAEGEPGKKA
jgi:hypothetical protein